MKFITGAYPICNSVRAEQHFLEMREAGASNSFTIIQRLILPAELWTPLYFIFINGLAFRYSPTLKEGTVLLHAKQALRGPRVIVQPLLDLSARKGWVVDSTLRPLYPSGKQPGKCFYSYSKTT
jgi:hypothetical protein